MVLNLIKYLLSSELILLIFFLCWRLFLGRTKEYDFNRLWLLSGLVLSIMGPFIPNWISASTAFSGITLPVVEVGGKLNDVVAQDIGLFSTVLMSVYACGLFVGILKLATGFAKIMKLKSSASVGESRVHTLKSLNSLEAFSFFNWIFIPEDSDDATKSCLILHEKAHTKQWHSLDVLLVELYQVIHWFSPLVKLYAKSVRDNHEFIADQMVLQANIDRDIYINSLLRAHQSKLQISLVHSFSNKSSIKNRLIMMHKNQKNSSKWLLLMAIPFFSIAVLAACTKADINQENAIAENAVKEADVMPEFPGGNEAFMAFMIENVKYPESQKASGLSGNVVISFVVGKNGEVRDAKVLKSLHEDFDQAALQVVANMPHWKPGKSGDENVAVEMKLPIRFQLD